MPKPSNLSNAGLFKETTKGTGGAPTDFIPVTSFKAREVPIWLDDLAWRNSMIDSYDQQQGPIWSTVEIDGPVFADTFGYHLQSIYGSADFTLGSGAPNTWVFSPKNTGDGQPGSYCYTDTNAVQPRRWPGVQLDQLDFKWSAEGLLEYSAKGLGFASSTTTSATPTFSTEPIIPAWQLACQIAGSTILNVLSAEVSMKRKSAVIHTGDGTAAPYAIWLGDLAVEGKFDLVMEDESQLTNFLNNSKPSLDFTWSNGLATTALRTVQYHSTKTGFRTHDLDRSKEYIVQPISFKAHGNSTDVGTTGGQSHSKWTVKNLKATGTY